MDHPTGDVPSTAAIGGHPMHPMFIPFPIAFLCAALATDVTFAATTDAFWARASFWLTLVGLITGLLAAILGLVDFFTIRRARSLLAGWVHLIGNATVLVLAAVSVLLRREDLASAVWPTGLALSAVNVAILGVTGWLGGELSYRHRIGVYTGSAGQALASGAAARRIG